MPTTIKKAKEFYDNNEPRGEYVLVIEGQDGQTAEYNPLLELSPEEHVAKYEKDGLSRMDAIKAAARDRGIKKNELYKMLLDGREDQD